MADEQYRWLDRETAERLLRGESLEAVDPADRDQAERLAKTLEALTAEPSLTSEELPGEAAALAAFRSARARRDNAAATDADATAAVGGHSAGPVADAGLVRIGAPAHAVRRPRLGRPLRLGLAAALAAGMIGGVAFAAGTGVLPTPFDGDEPAPGASVSAPVTPERPLISPTPGNGALGEPTPDPSAGDTDRNTAPGGSPTDRDSAGRNPSGHPHGWWKGVTSSCRDVRDGKGLSVNRRRVLEGAAGGSARVWSYCKGVLTDAGESLKGGQDLGQGHGKGKDRPQGDGHGKGGDDEGHAGGSGGHANGGGSGSGHGGGDGHGGSGVGSGGGHHADSAGEAPSVTSPLVPKLTTPSREIPSPSPSYSTL